MKIELSIIIVNRNTKDLLEHSIHSIYNNTLDINYEIIVVDNGSIDGSQEKIKNQFRDVILIQNNSNVGFSTANNQGIRISKGTYILLLNSDTIILKDAIKKLVEFLVTHEEAAIVGPKLLFENGTVQCCYGSFPNLRSEIARALLLEEKLNKRRTLNDKRLKYSKPFEADWISGACFMFRKSILKEIGELDERFFLFNEEVDFCLRTRKAGWKVFCHPDAEIIHYKGKTTQKAYYVLIASRYESRLKYAEKHYGYLRRLIFRMIVVFALLFRILIGSFLVFSGEAEKKDRLKAYVQSLLLHIGLKRYNIKFD